MCVAGGVGARHTRSEGTPGAAGERAGALTRRTVHVCMRACWGSVQLGKPEDALHPRALGSPKPTPASAQEPA